MVLNWENHLIINKQISEESIELGNKTLNDEAEQMLFGIILENKLNFQSYAKSIIKS